MKLQKINILFFKDYFHVKSGKKIQFPRLHLVDFTIDMRNAKYKLNSTMLWTIFAVYTSAQLVMFRYCKL